MNFDIFQDNPVFVPNTHKAAVVKEKLIVPHLT